jgi:hypothetical protein
MAWYRNSEGRYGINGAKGDLGELIVEDFCKTTGRKWEDAKDYYSQVKLKIDCIIDDIPVDVKANGKKNTLTVEMSTSKDPGWLFTTTATEIYGVVLEGREIYRYNVSDMIAYLNKNKVLIKSYNGGTRLAYVQKNLNIIERLQ